MAVPHPGEIAAAAAAARRGKNNKSRRAGKRKPARPADATPVTSVPRKDKETNA